MATPTQDMHCVLAFMATEVDKGDAIGHRSLGSLSMDQTVPGLSTDPDGTKGYTKDDIASLMGFAGVSQGVAFPDI
jgi:hypothetical protein